MEIKKLFQKRFISIILTGVFLVVSVTGIMMFYRVESFNVNEVHAWVGMGFVFVGLYHLIKNFSPFKSYMKYTSSSIILLLIILSSMWYIKPIDSNSTNPRKEMMNAVFTQPLTTVCIFLKKDIEKVIENMSLKGVIIKDTNKTLMQIAKENNEDMKKIFFIFFEK